MSEGLSCLVNRFDHIEIAAKDLGHLEKLFRALGYVCTQARETELETQKLMLQGQSRVVLTQGRPGSFAHEYVSKHGDGVCSIAYHSSDAQKTLSTALSRGATLAEAYRTEQEGSLRVGRAAIRSFGDVRATFVERSADAFDVNAPFGVAFRPTGERVDDTVGFLVVDHLTNNVEMGKLEEWSDFYKNIYGWIETRYFDIKASRTGLHSKVLQSPDGATKIPINEATEEKSQIQEFINDHKGAGVQHIAMSTVDIRKTVKELKKRGFQFLETPQTYYDDVPKRVPNVKEPLGELQELGILVDGDEKGYLLQIFTQNQIGPLFFEVIQRRGNQGFGEGNFKALFEAIERDQERRGVL